MRLSWKQPINLLLFTENDLKLLTFSRDNNNKKIDRGQLCWRQFSSKKQFAGFSTSFHLTPPPAQIFAFWKWEGQRVASDVSHAPA